MNVRDNYSPFLESIQDSRPCAGKGTAKLTITRELLHMNTPSLTNKHIAILAADGFEQVELEKPLEALEQAGAEVSIVSLSRGKIQGMNHLEKGDTFDVDIRLKDADPSLFDALVIPGGLVNPDALRADEDAVSFVREFAESGKPIAAICHGPWVLIEAGMVQGRTLTSWPAIQTDILNAGGNWVDEEVVVDHGLITSRKPDDLKAFNRKIIEEFASLSLPS